MKVRDPIHIPWAYSLAGAVQLPLTGDKHPLSLEGYKWIIWAGGIALFIGIASFGFWRWWDSRAPELASSRDVVIVRYTELGVPPSLAAKSTVAVNVAQAVAIPPTIAVPEPVPDELATSETIMTQDEINLALAAITATDLEGAGGNIQVVGGMQEQQREIASEMTAPINVNPVRLSMDRPEYPDMARMAGVEGTVMVNVQVGTNGKVLNVEVVEGPAALRQAAINAARTAVFKPASMNNRPVKVWVAMPITFKLHSS